MNSIRGIGAWWRWGGEWCCQWFHALRNFKLSCQCKV